MELHVINFIWFNWLEIILYIGTVMLIGEMGLESFEKHLVFNTNYGLSTFN